MSDLTEAGYQVAKEKSMKKIGMRLEKIYKDCLEKI